LELYVDDQKTELNVAPEQPLDVVLENIKERVGGKGRMIVSIVCDGIDIADEELAGTLQQPASDFKRVEMHSADPSELVLDALTQAEILLDHTSTSATEIVEHLTCGNHAKAMPLLSSCCQAWLQVHGGIANALATLHIDADSILVDEEPMTNVLAAPIRMLNDIRESIAAKDFVLLSDILNYELEEAIDGWRGIIKSIRDSAANQRDTNRVSVGG